MLSTAWNGKVQLSSVRRNKAMDIFLAQLGWARRRPVLHSEAKQGVFFRHSQVMMGTEQLAKAQRSQAQRFNAMSISWGIAESGVVEFCIVRRSIAELGTIKSGKAMVFRF